jgi:peptidoglycan glycosyltransferase
MNRALRRISLACLVMFVALLINVNYLQGFESSSLANETGNSRSFDQQYQYQRGSITTSDGVTIAASRPTKGIYKYQRYYSDGPVYAPVTSPIRLPTVRVGSVPDSSLFSACSMPVCPYSAS